MADKLVPIKVSDFPDATTIDGSHSIGVDKDGKSVKFPIVLLKGNKGDQGDPGEVTTEQLNATLVSYAEKIQIEVPTETSMINVNANHGKFLGYISGGENTHSAFSVSGYEAVTEGQILEYSGRTGSNGAAIVGYDADKLNPVIILGSAGLGANDYYDKEKVIIPNGISFFRTSGQFTSYSGFPLPITLSCTIFNETIPVVEAVLDNNNKMQSLNDDYLVHKNGKADQSTPIIASWISGYYTESGSGSSESWIHTEVSVDAFDAVKLHFACPVNYAAKSFFVNASGVKVGDLIGSDIGDIFQRPSSAVKLRISNRIVGDGTIEGVADPTITGVVNGVSKFANEQFVKDYVRPAKNKFCHMSFDDVRNVWSDLVANENSYTSMFDNSLLGWLKSMRDKYGIVCTLIIDYIERLGTYPVPEKFRQEFVDNMDWLKLGFQAKNNTDYRLQIYETALAHYNEFAENVMSLFGTWEIIDRVVRNNFFHSNINVANGLRDAKCGAIGFLGCDDWSYNAATRIVNVYLTDEQSQMLDKRDRWFDYTNDFWLFKTDFRFEQVVQRWGNINNCIADYESLNRANEAYDLVVFSHENYYPSLKGMMETFFAAAKDRGYRFDFPMNVLL